MRVLVPLLLLAACSEPLSGPTAVFDPDGAFFDAPWPSDARTVDGVPDWLSFPNPSDLLLLDSFLQLGSRRQGFGQNAPIYFRLAESVEVSALPQAHETLLASSVVQLVDIDPRSPEFGSRVPVRFDVWEDPGVYTAANLVAVAPLAGFPLRPRTTYALVVTTGLAAAAPAFKAAWDGDGPWAESLGVLDAALPWLELDRDDIALATTFTTSDPLEEMEAIARFLDERVEPPIFRTELERRYTLGSYEVFRTDYVTPLLQHGDKPYDSEGGGFVFRDDGLPEIASWDEMRMSVVLPAERVEPPESGWPVVVYLHGTGGTYRTFCNSSSEFEVGTWLSQMGVVGLGIDLPLHGPRGTDDTIISLHSFNVLQPDSALHIHRQAATDLLHLLHGLADRDNVFTTPSGESVPLDRERILVMGHSQGALTASIALPFAGEMINGAMISGGGGLLAITAVERDADFDFPELIRGILGLDPSEHLTELHPVLGLVQSLVEPTDPINFAPHWLYEDGGYTGAKPVPVLITSGIRDDQTPSRTAEALAAAARIPFVGPRWSRGEGMLLRGLDSQPLPVDNNVRAWNGQLFTAGLSQWEKGDHFVIFRDPEARDVVRQFVHSVLIEQAPVIAAGPPEPPNTEVP